MDGNQRKKIIEEANTKRPIFRDLYHLEEDQRIQAIGDHVMKGQVVAFCVDKNKEYEGKGDRYIKKLQERFPGIVIIDRFDGPVDETETIKVGPPK